MVSLRKLRSYVAAHRSLRRFGSQIENSLDLLVSEESSKPLDRRAARVLDAADELVSSGADNSTAVKEILRTAKGATASLAAGREAARVEWIRQESEHACRVWHLLDAAAEGGPVLPPSDAELARIAAVETLAELPPSAWWQHLVSLAPALAELETLVQSDAWEPSGPAGGSGDAGDIRNVSNAVEASRRRQRSIREMVSEVLAGSSDPLLSSNYAYQLAFNPLVRVAHVPSTD